MAHIYETVSIAKAISEIDGDRYLLPAIQRRFVWGADQILALFDSIMREFPINTFMMWEITDPDIKNDHKFYKFLEHYVQRFKEGASEITPSGTFKAIIDGPAEAERFLYWFLRYLRL